MEMRVSTEKTIRSDSNPEKAAERNNCAAIIAGARTALLKKHHPPHSGPSLPPLFLVLEETRAIAKLAIAHSTELQQDAACSRGGGKQTKKHRTAFTQLAHQFGAGPRSKAQTNFASINMFSIAQARSCSRHRVFVEGRDQQTARLPTLSLFRVGSKRLFLAAPLAHAPQLLEVATRQQY